MSQQALIEQLRSQIRSIESETERSAPNNLARSISQEVDPDAIGLTSTADDDANGEADEAFRKILALVNASDKSEKTVRTRLESKGYSAEAIEEAISRAKSYSIIDDERFAELLIRSRVAQGKGKQGIERELRTHGIDPDALSCIDSEEGVYGNQMDRALELLERKPPRSKNLREGAYRKLMQKGYSSSVASSASRLWFEEHVQN